MSDRFRFGDATFDAATGDLAIDGVTRRLEPQPARVLAMLLESSGSLVTREALREALWAETAVDFDQGINYCIRQIRIALGDDAAAPRFVETLPRRGYRFLLEAHPLDADKASGPGDATAGPPRPIVPPPPRKGAAREFAIALTIILVAIALFWLGPASRVAERRKQQDIAREQAEDTLMSPAGRAAGRIKVPRPLRMAILAGSISEDADVDAELDRLLEDLVADFTALGADKIGVVGPVTTGPFAASDRPLTEIGAQLGVDYVLSVSLDPTSGAFAQVIGIPGGEHLFATRFPVAADEAARRATSHAGTLAAIEKASERPLTEQ